MASDTANVKLGVCKVTFNDVDLGYTKGGVEVEVSTETHKVMVDQFGNSEINERITGRSVKAKVPLAETTIELMATIMPGSEVTTELGTAATAFISFAGVPTENDTITVNGVVFTFKATPVLGTDIDIKLTASAQATETAVVLNASVNALVSVATYAADVADVDVVYDTLGVAGNAFTLAKSGTDISVSGAVLSGGVDTKKRIDVTNGVGISLLASAAELRLHPIDLLEADVTDDFVIPLANTPGALTFAYKLDEERIYNVEFTGYPDPTTRILFLVGDDTAV